MASSYGTDAGKTALRATYVMARRQIPARARLASDAGVRATLGGFDLFANAPLVLAYRSRPGDVDTLPVIEGLLAAGRRVAMPHEDPKTGRLEFFEVTSPLDLDPDGSGHPLAAPELVGSVCLVPGLVFDADGHRIGNGGGAYDRFLAFYPGDKVALARITQVSGNPLPAEAHDVPVDFLVTESGVWSCR